MTQELTKQEQEYLLQVVMQRPLAEALPVFLKLTGQQLVPVPTPAPGS